MCRPPIYPFHQTEYYRLSNLIAEAANGSIMDSINGSTTGNNNPVPKFDWKSFKETVDSLSQNHKKLMDNQVNTYLTKQNAARNISAAVLSDNIPHALILLSEVAKEIVADRHKHNMSILERNGELATQNSQLNASKEDQKRVIDGLLARIDEQTTIIEDQKSMISKYSETEREQSTRIATLEGELGMAKAALPINQQSINEMALQNSQLKLEIENRDNSIKQLNHRVENQAKIIADQRVEISQVEQLKTELYNTKSMIESFYSDMKKIIKLKEGMPDTKN